MLSGKWERIFSILIKFYRSFDYFTMFELLVFLFIIKLYAPEKYLQSDTWKTSKDVF